MAGVSKINQDISDLNRTLKKFEIETDAILNMVAQDSTETTYKHAVRSIIRPTEGDGAPPNLDTGLLALSMGWNYDKQTKRGVVYNIDEKSFNLETIWNRPFLRPALKKVRRSYKSRIKRMMKKAIKRAEKNA